MDNTFNNVLEFINFINSVSEQILNDCFGEEVADTIISARCCDYDCMPYAYDFLKRLNATSLAEYMSTFKNYKAEHFEKTVVEYHISELIDIDDLQESDIVCYYNPKYKKGDIVDKNNIFKVSINEDYSISLFSDYNDKVYTIDKIKGAIFLFTSISISKIKLFKCNKIVKEIITSEPKKSNNIMLSDLEIGDSFKFGKKARHQYKLVEVKIPDYEPAQSFVCALNYNNSKIYFLNPNEYTEDGERLENLEYGDTFRLQTANSSSSLMIKVKFSGGPYEYCIYNKQTYEVETNDNCAVIPIF